MQSRDTVSQCSLTKQAQENYSLSSVVSTTPLPSFPTFPSQSQGQGSSQHLPTTEEDNRIQDVIDVGILPGDPEI